jgi:hypothetical protein
VGIGSIKAILRQKGYKIYTRPYELNLVGVRSKDSVPNSFDDEFWLFWENDKGDTETAYWKGTTDPGTYWLNNPSYDSGTAMLKEGQYVDCYSIGLHKGQYSALVQTKAVTVYRDANRDSTLNFGGKVSTGLFGINIHAPSGEGDKKTIGKDSAGCQVCENRNSHLFLMAKAEIHRKLYGNKFTYTLIDYRAERKLFWKRTLYAGMSIAALAAGGFVYSQSDFNNTKNG